MSRATRVARILYDLAFPLALPALRKNARLARGWSERTLKTAPPRAELWVQAASAGEAWLADELLSRPISGVERALVATNTDQGRDILDKTSESQDARPGAPAVLPAYMPFDRPSLARRALRAVSPKVLVLLETELWPGLLWAAKTEGIPVVLINGRMRTRSLARYLTAGRIFSDLAPNAVLAVSEADAARFALLFQTARVETMSNIKFDRVAESPDIPYVKNPLSSLLRPGAPFVALGSVREEEEDAVLAIISTILAERPGTIVGLFPRHMERIPAWRERLAGAGLAHILRSEAAGYAPSGSVLVWDVFGELTPAYALARAVFVGGSLAPLGGQNFLEPLAAGVRPVIGPSWSNFAWVGRELLDQGLVTRVDAGGDVATALLAGLARNESREAVREEALTYVKARQGGAERARSRIAEYLPKA